MVSNNASVKRGAQLSYVIARSETTKQSQCLKAEIASRAFQRGRNYTLWLPVSECLLFHMLEVVREYAIAE